MTKLIEKKFLSQGVLDYFEDQIDVVDAKAVAEKTRAEAQEAAIRTEFAAADDAKLAEAKAYAETKAAEVKSELLGGIPSETLDTIAEIALALASEQTATGTILSQLSSLESGKASKEELASGVAEAKAYTDTQIAAIPIPDISGKADTTYVDTQDQAIQSDLDDLDGYAQDIRSDVDGQETRIVALEAKKVPVPKQKYFLIDEVSELSYLDLGELAMPESLVVFYNINVIRPGLDFSVSTVNGQTRLTWISDLVPGQRLGVESGDEFFVSFMV